MSKIGRDTAGWIRWLAALVAVATLLPARAWAASGALSPAGMISLAAALVLLLPALALMARQAIDDLRARRGGIWYAEQDASGSRRVVRADSAALPHRHRAATVVAWGYFSNQLDAATRELLGQAPARRRPDLEPPARFSRR